MRVVIPWFRFVPPIMWLYAAVAINEPFAVSWVFANDRFFLSDPTGLIRDVNSEAPVGRRSRRCGRDFLDCPGDSYLQIPAEMV